MIFVNDLPFRWFNTIRFSLPAFLLTVAASISYRLLRDRSRNERRAEQKEKENLQSELLFLRSQISPHFLFNVLNNMLALARLRSDQLEPTIFKLSSLMRYMLYEADQERVPLNKEFDYLLSYIDLQRQRIVRKEMLKINIEEPDKPYLIAPMLLIPFIENAFKHGFGGRPDCFIDIFITAKEDVLFMKVVNSNNARADSRKDSSSGIGLNNVQRRLELLYKDGYHLCSGSQNNHFLVALTIKLSSYDAVYNR